MMTNRTSRYSVSTVQAAADARGAGRHDQRHRDERSRHERRELADECRTDWLAVRWRELFVEEELRRA